MPRQRELKLIKGEATGHMTRSTAHKRVQPKEIADGTMRVSLGNKEIVSDLMLLFRVESHNEVLTILLSRIKQTLTSDEWTRWQALRADRR